MVFSAAMISHQGEPLHHHFKVLHT